MSLRSYGKRQRALAGACLVAAALFLLVAAAVAGPRDYLTGKNQTLCDRDNKVCVRGTLIYDKNPQLLQLRSRVIRASGPGVLRFRVVGQNELGHVRRATLEVEIRGRSSEIVSTKMIPDAPDVDEWSLEVISFVERQSKTGPR